MNRFTCTLCGSTDWPRPDTLCPLCRADDEDETETPTDHEPMNTHHTHEPMNTYDRQPQSLREYMAENSDKSAKEIQNEIAMIRACYARRMNANQHRRDALVGWSLIVVALAVPAIVAAAVLFF